MRMQALKTRLALGLALALALPLLGACAAGPQPAHWGVEECTHCRMVIGDERFAGQVVDRRGKTYKFDALECMAAWLNDAAVAEADLHSTWIASGRDGWIRVEEATFLHSEGLRSPMGGGYTGYATADEARRLQAQVGGELMTWGQLRARAADHEPGAHAGHDHHGAEDHAGHGAGAH
jgi:copper chaperone NosL